MVKKQNYKEASPDIQCSIVAGYLYGVRGCGRETLAKKYNLPDFTVRNILTRTHENKGDPVRPRGHKQRRLSLADQRKLFRTLDGKPLATNRELAATVHHKIKSRTVSDYLAIAKLRFTPHTLVNQEPEGLTEELKTEMRSFIGKVKNICLTKEFTVIKLLSIRKRS
jgi:transposase